MTSHWRSASRLIEVDSMPDEGDEPVPCRAPCRLAAIRKATFQTVRIFSSGFVSTNPETLNGRKKEK